MQSIFVTGIDTNVGKTVIAACIAQAARKSGIDVGIMKPFAAFDGNASEKYNSPDTEILARAAGCVESDFKLNPVFSKIPASPYTASHKSDLQFDIRTVLDAYDALDKSHEMMVVEGIGGVMTPIHVNYFVTDLIKQMNLPVLIIVHNKIGAINHTILTHMACKNAEISIMGFVVNCIDDAGYDPNLLAKDIVSITDTPVLGIVPKTDLTDENTALDMISNALNLDSIGIKA
ncbi:MAG: dethiobiotin synthase [Cenarchaeum symbiont of Oopsacas minuta]|nr:dethiobiotin synthase [Cenarchaeum symbiont of Oopsacas minuta]